MDFAAQRREKRWEGESRLPARSPRDQEEPRDPARGLRQPRPRPHPKFLERFPGPLARCPNLGRPAETKGATQGTEPGAGCASGRAVPVAPPRAWAHSPAGARPGPGPLGTCPQPTSFGAAPRPLLTWPEDCSGDQEAEDQTAGGGSLGCHIPPPSRGRGALTESTPQEGASSRAPRCPRARGSRRQGQSLCAQTHCPSGLWRCTSGFLWLATLHLPGPRLLLPVSTRPRSLRPLLPAPAPSLSARHWSNRERCSWRFSAGVFFS